MSKRLFGEHIEPACSYCARGRISANGDTVLCEKSGVMNPADSCRRFVYDPLRRTPTGHAVLEQHEHSEFEITSRP